MPSRGQESTRSVSIHRCIDSLFDSGWFIVIVLIKRYLHIAIVMRIRARLLWERYSNKVKLVGKLNGVF